MHYFDNAPLIESITEAITINTSNTKGNTAWWIAGLITVSCIAAVYICEYERLKKEFRKEH